jgi:hypothetical protein
VIRIVIWGVDLDVLDNWLSESPFRRLRPQGPRDDGAFSLVAPKKVLDEVWAVLFYNLPQGAGASYLGEFIGVSLPTPTNDRVTRIGEPVGTPQSIIAKKRKLQEINTSTEGHRW